MADEDMVLLDLTRAGVAIVTLNRPDVHNAFNPDVIERLTQIFEDIGNQETIRLALLEGRGKSFSAGADLAWMRAAADWTEEESFEDARGLGRMFKTMRTLPQPIIGAVHGPALAGGLGLVACCDIVIATENAFFGLSEVRLGLTPATISPYVVEAIGPRAARRYFLTGERFDAREAFRLGLVHMVVKDKNELAAATEELVTAMFQTAPGAVAVTKKLINDVAFAEIDDDLIEDTARRIAERRQSDEGREGTQSFLEKRKPSWAE